MQVAVGRKEEACLTNVVLSLGGGIGEERKGRRRCQNEMDACLWVPALLPALPPTRILLIGGAAILVALAALDDVRGLDAATRQELRHGFPGEARLTVIVPEPSRS
jgi:hypothetical protein